MRTPQPAVLKKNASRWIQALRQASTPVEKKKAEHKYAHPKIKEALIAMFHGKCAYCESHILHIDYGHIEHFKPKSKYRDSSFDWDNLLLACGRCNGVAYKGDKFPNSSEGGPLVNPCEDDPTEHLVFRYDLQSGLATVRGTTQRGLITEKLLGLNRLELRKHRSEYVRKLVVLSRLAATDPEARKLLDEAKSSTSEYAAFARGLI